MSTVEVSEIGLPVSCVSNFASSSLRSRRSATARLRTRERSTGANFAHTRWPRCALSMAAATSLAEDMPTRAMTSPVAGFTSSSQPSPVAVVRFPSI